MPPVRGDKSLMLSPMRQVADGQPRLRPEGDSIGIASQHILAIDDDSTVQEILTCFLGDGYRVQGAATGAEALRRLRREPVDLVVLDHRLPGRTGLEILPEVRLIRPKVPVIMLTGYGSEWICAAAFKLGIADYLQKPVSAVDLVAAVRRILSPGAGRGKPPSESPMPAGGRAPLCMPVEKAIGLIQHRYWEHFSLSTLARQVGMSKCRLSHRFHEVLGVTFRDYLMSVRLERAKALLAAGHVSITEVAQGVGFSDLPRFDKVFKRYTGLTPSAYRSSTPRRRKYSATNNY
jgi:two-component system, response regulator YesN